MSSRIRFVSAVLAFAAAGIVASDATDSRAGGANKAFLKLDAPQGQVQGESNDPAHRGWMDISSISMGASRSTGVERSASAASGAGAGKVNFHEFNITRKIDKASPMLRQAAVSGTHFKDAVVEMVKASADGTPAVYYRVTMSDVLVSSYKLDSAGPAPTESLTFSFAKVQYEYANKSADGSPGSYSPVQEGWDVKTNLAM